MPDSLYIYKPEEIDYYYKVATKQKGGVRYDQLMEVGMKKLKLEGTAVLGAGTEEEVVFRFTLECESKLQDEALLRSVLQLFSSNVEVTTSV